MGFIRSIPLEVMIIKSFGLKMINKFFLIIVLVIEEQNNYRYLTMSISKNILLDN